LREAKKRISTLEASERRMAARIDSLVEAAKVKDFEINKLVEQLKVAEGKVHELGQNGKGKRVNKSMRDELERI
jgi:hypothetical protein